MTTTRNTRLFCFFCGDQLRPKNKGPLPLFCRKQDCKRRAARERQRRHREKVKVA